MNKEKTVKKEATQRINTRITVKQHAYIRAKAIKLGLTEGEVTRMMLQEYITNNPK